MIAKKNSTTTASSAHSEPSSPLSPAFSQRQSQLLQANNSNLPSAPRKSSSKGKRLSAKKLFQKAHETEEGETYLKGLKSQRSSGEYSNGRTCPPAKMAKATTLTVNKELNIKVRSNDSEDAHQISNIINQFGGDSQGLWTQDLSSIRQDDWDMPSEAGDSQSLLNAIPSA